MGKKFNRCVTAVMTVAGLALLLALMGSVAFVTRSEPLLSDPTAGVIVSERPTK